MCKSLVFLFFFFVLICPLGAQILPKEGSNLNYRLIGFSFPLEKNAGKSSLEIAKGNWSTEEAFKKNIIKKQPCKTNKIVIELASFGSQYSWRVVYTDAKQVTKAGELHHFSTDINKRVNMDSTRLRIAKTNEKYKDDFLFIDHSGVLYDMKGAPVWFLPKGDEIISSIRDMKLSAFGTITYLAKDSAYEVNYAGDIIWQGPNNGKVSGDSAERYHHEFKRMANGHYMLLGDEVVLWKKKLLTANDSNIAAPAAIKAHFGTIIEYNEKGDVVWTWRSSGYFIKSDVNYYDGSRTGEEDPVHENAFYFDEQHKIIYVGFKNISRILKVKYPEGTVIESYGEIYKAGIPASGNGLFCSQHSIGLTENGYLYMFNNNTCNEGKAATVILMKEPGPGEEGLKKVWEYVCPVEAGRPPLFTTGGNVVELKDHSLLVCMGLTMNKILIVGRDKKIAWSAFNEAWSPYEKKWWVLPQYRTNIIEGRKNLEKLIWNVETK